MRPERAQPLQQLKAVRSRRFEIANDHIKFFRPEHTDCLSSTSNTLDQIAVFAERGDNAQIQLFLVFNNKDTPLFGHRYYHLQELWSRMYTLQSVSRCGLVDKRKLCFTTFCSEAK